MTLNPQVTQHTDQAVFHIEEACLGVLIDAHNQGTDLDGVKTDEVTRRSGLQRKLGYAESMTIVEKILLNLHQEGKVEPRLQSMIVDRWKITEREVSNRQSPT